MNSSAKQSGLAGKFWSGLANFWRLVLVTHRYALAARFSVISGFAAAAAFLAVDQGRETLRALVEPRTFSSAYNLAMAPNAPPATALPWTQFGWFSFMVIALSIACWVTTRLCYALAHDQLSGEDALLERLMEDKLPMYFGALPLVIAGCGFLQEAFTYLPETSRPRFLPLIVWGAPLLLLFGVPTLVILRRLWFGDDPVLLTRPGPGLRSVLYPCAILPPLAWAYLRSGGGASIALPALFVSEYFFLLAIGIFRLQKPWLAGVASLALLVAHFTGQGDEHAGTALMTIALLHGLLGVILQQLIGSQMQAPLAFERNLKFGQIARLIFFFPPKGLSIGQMEKAILRTTGWISLLCLAVLIEIWLEGQRLPHLLGTAAVLCAGLIGWTVVGNGLLIGVHAARIPLILFALLWAILCSICEDNHVVRIFQPPAPAQSAAPTKTYPNTTKLFEEWHRRVQTPYPFPGKKRPCFIVASEGGGIRAAFWTAQVLARLEDESLKAITQPGQPDFASHTLAISGVSGGSLGAAAFDALYAEELPSLTKGPNGEILKTDASYIGQNAAYILGSDHLSPLVGSLLFPDAIQRFVPLTLPRTDRGAALELSWEHAWKMYVGGPRNRFSESFLNLWKEADQGGNPWLPALFLNSTRVDDGRRTIVSNVKIVSGPQGDFADAVDLHDYLFDRSTILHNPLDRLRELFSRQDDGTSSPSAARDVRLSTAVHCSARFTYFSPVGRLPTGHRVDDGGYYENSGALTAREILDVVNHSAPKDEAVEPIILLIRYIEGSPADLDFPPVPVKSGPSSVSAYAASDASAPIITLLNVRGAHASEEYGQFGQLQSAGLKVCVFTLFQRQIPLPLGWMLSGRAASEMVTQMPQIPGNDQTAPPDSPVLQHNLDGLQNVIKWLHGEGL